MKGTKDVNRTNLIEHNVGAGASARPSSKARQNNGITLIALVITIIVMLILVAVTISMAVNGGLFEYAGKAVGDTQNALNAEQAIADGGIEVDGVYYNSINEYLTSEPPIEPGLYKTGTIADGTNVLIASWDELIEGDVVHNDNGTVYSGYYSYWDLVDNMDVEVYGNTSSEVLKGDLLLPCDESVTSLDDYAFAHCSGLTDVIMSGNISDIGKGAFYNCDSYICAKVPVGVISIGKEAFRSCSSLTSVTLPGGLESLGDWAFAYDENLVEVNLPEDFTTIPEFCFIRCSSLQTIELPSSLEVIGSASFSVCSGLIEVDIPDSVVEIGDYAFGNCDSLKTFTIPSSVQGVGTGVFCDCDSLESITFESSSDWVMIDSEDPSVWVENIDLSNPNSDTDVLFANPDFVTYYYVRGDWWLNGGGEMIYPGC